MRIISKFTDYYDSIQGVAFDSDILYIRKKESFDLNQSTDIKFRYLSTGIHFIGFCGKVYVMHKFEYYPDRFNPHPISEYIEKHNIAIRTVRNGEYHFSYDIDESLIMCDLYDQRKYTSKVNTSRYRNKLDDCVNVILKNDIFEKFNTPIFVINVSNGDYKLTIGCSLKDYNFQSQSDPFTAYQELVMWIGNKAVNEYPPQIMDDVVMRDKKGFDKWSFKKKPTKRIKR